MAHDSPPTDLVSENSPGRRSSIREEDLGQVRSLAIGAIEPNPRQPRRYFDPAQLDALARSIAGQGIMQPVVVRPHPDHAERYQLVAGERRWRAVTRLGWDQIPALVRDVADENLLETALVENIQREALTPIEEASAYRTLLDQYQYTQETLSARVGRDRSTIANMVRLLSLPPGLQEDLEVGRLSVGHARALLTLGTPDAQVAVRDRILARGLSVRDTERLAHRLKQGGTGTLRGHPSHTSNPPESGDSRVVDDPRFEAARDRLEEALATRVAIHLDDETGAGEADGPGGRIEIRFYSLEDFNRLYEELTHRS